MFGKYELKFILPKSLSYMAMVENFIASFICKRTKESVMSGGGAIQSLDKCM